MVGLYHKRRAQRSHSKVLGFLTKALMTLGLMVVIGFVLIVLFFNGSQIKKPLSTYLSAKTGFEVTIGDAEFSPIYPDVIKLYDVSFGNSKLGELYLEYDLRSALSEERLEINDLYLNGVTITPEDLQALTENRLGYHSIYATLVRFHHTPVKTQFLHTKDATIRLNNVGFNPEEGLTFRSGAIAALEAELLESPVKDLSLQFAHDQAGLNIENFTAAMLGGMVSGQGRYLFHDNTSNSDTSTGFSSAEGFSQNGNADLIFDELNLSKVILHDLGRPQVGINLSARNVNLSEVIYTNDQQAMTAAAKQDSTNKAETKAGDHPNYHSMVMQGISGQLHDLELGHEHFSARFDGTIDALSFPNLQTSFEHNKGTAELKDDQISFDFKGTLYDGKYSLKGTLDREHQELSLAEVKLAKSKLALNPPRLDFLQHNNAYTIKLAQGSFESLEFLSFLNQLPLSIQSISGSASNLQWGPAPQPETNSGTQNEPTTQAELTPATLLGQLKTSDHGELKLNLHNLLYSNLLFSDIELEAALSPKQLQVNLPKVKFQEASLSASGTLSLSDTGMSTLALEASDFESADLNSNLIGHMLTGKVNLNAQLTSSFTNWHEAGLKNALLQNLSGRIHLDSAGLLISDFGLDLINGGKQQDYTLSGTELLAALQGSVAGINTLEADTTFQAGKLNAQGRIGLATANTSFSANIDLLNHDFSGNAFMVSLARDSTTTVSFDGTTAEPSFAIRALSRGAPRPGLYLPQYDATAQAKEQTDAKGVLNGTVQLDDAESAVAQSAAASEAPAQVSDTPINAESAPAQAEASTTPDAEPAAAESANAKSSDSASTEPNAGEPSSAEGESDAAATAENAAETSTPDAAEVAQDAGSAAETSTSTDAEPKADETTAPAEDAAETDATEVAQDAGSAAETSTSTDAEPKADETTAPAEDAAETDATEAAQGAGSAAETSASTDTEPKADETTAPAEDAAETSTPDATEGVESAAAESNGSTDAEPKADETTAPAEDAAETSTHDAAEVAQDADPAAETSVSTDTEPKADEATVPAEDAAETSTPDATEAAQDAEPAAEPSVSMDTEPKADEATAPAENAAETSAPEGESDPAATADQTSSASEPAATEDADAASESKDAAATTDETSAPKGESEAAQDTKSDAESTADTAPSTDGTSTVPNAGEAAASEGKTDAVEVAHGSESAAESSSTAEQNTDAAGAAEAASAGAQAQATESLPDAAAQAQADQTEFELLKDVFIDSFIQHEHGTAAEEEAAKAAAQKDAAARKAAEEKPYDPEEEMIF
ncbi:MAG: hypothetical protein ROM54_05465 [Anaerobiospirillum sp.]|nr:hypothetical protein [Anaerobiospirillum sp.]